MSERRTVPIAYVTKWATTAGILVVHDAQAVGSGALYKERVGGFGPALYVPKNDWTEDKAEAEARYCAKIDAARQSAERRVQNLVKMYLAVPKYTEG